MNAILALDQGTTSSRAIVFDHNGVNRGVAQHELTQIFPDAGWVEHDLLEIWRTQIEVARAVLKKVGMAAADIAGVTKRVLFCNWRRCHCSGSRIGNPAATGGSERAVGKMVSETQSLSQKRESSALVSPVQTTCVGCTLVVNREPSSNGCRTTEKLPRV